MIDLPMIIAAFLIGWPGVVQALAVDVGVALVKVAAALVVLAWTAGGVRWGLRMALS